jgi:pimeloyl-ACP methyl ester carboxylesterase
MAKAVLALMDALGIEKTALVGHSLGGGVALLAAVMAPERVERLALIGSIAYPQPEPPFVTLPRLPLAWLPMMLFPRRFVEEGLRVAYVHPERLEPDAITEYARPYRAFAGAKAYQRICRALRPSELDDYISVYPSLKTPLLILHGERDNVVPLWVPERLHQEVSHSTYHRLPGVGHMLLEEEPDLVIRHLLPFLTG